MARQAALLILVAHNVARPDSVATSDYYRQALALDLRDRREFSEMVLNAMGGISRSQFSRYKSLLGLSNDALELADRHSLDEGRLRNVLSIPPEYHVEIVQQIIDRRLTRAQVKAICVNGDTPIPNIEDEPFPKSALRFAKFVSTKEAFTPQELAGVLTAQEADFGVIKARLNGIRRLLDETEHYLETS